MVLSALLPAVEDWPAVGLPVPVVGVVVTLPAPEVDAVVVSSPVPLPTVVSAVSAVVPSVAEVPLSVPTVVVVVEDSGVLPSLFSGVLPQAVRPTSKQTTHKKLKARFISYTLLFIP